MRSLELMMKSEQSGLTQQSQTIVEPLKVRAILKEVDDFGVWSEVKSQLTMRSRTYLKLSRKRVNCDDFPVASL